MSEKLDKFVDLMKGIFELDKSDLDFGIYRIINIRKAEIENFLSNGLPQKINETLSACSKEAKETEARIKEIEMKCVEFGVDVSATKMVDEYNELKTKLVKGIDMSALEADIYSALYNFFSRYYDQGDFISKRRYKEGVYAIPYEGEEVKLYWANEDQYYIKTSENFKDYKFKAGDYTVHFCLADATTEQNNSKENAENKRQFMLYTENDIFPDVKTFEYNNETKEFIIRFVYDIPTDKKRNYKLENYEVICNYITENKLPVSEVLLADYSIGKNKKTTTLLEKHLNAYVAKNTFDYFIHKDLKGFLRRELDFYIKSEIMHLDDLDTSNEQRVETYLTKVKAIKRVGYIIIDFLAQMENFQKKLWLKKKFVTETNWCITLDKIDRIFYPEIIENKAQIREWIEMYAVDEIEESITDTGFTNPPSIEFLEENPYLVIDTKNFSEDFKERLIASIDNIDEQTGGLIINSDNFQALNLLQKKYKNKITEIYIDPPYNTGDDGFVYKDNYQSSTWLSMMKDRISLGYNLLENDGVNFINVGDEEQEHLTALVRQLYGKSNIFATLIWEKKKKGSFLNGKIVRMKDYILCLSKGNNFNGLIGEINKKQRLIL